MVLDGFLHRNLHLESASSFLAAAEEVIRTNVLLSQLYPSFVSEEEDCAIVHDLRRMARRVLQIGEPLKQGRSCWMLVPGRIDASMCSDVNIVHYTLSTTELSMISLDASSM